MRYLILVIVGLALAGCQTDGVTPAVDRYHVILPPEALYNCPVVTVWPKIETLTDLQTAKLIVRLAENNKICKTSVDALKKFLNEAKRKFEK